MEPRSEAYPGRGWQQVAAPATYARSGPIVGSGTGQIASVGRRTGAYLIDGAIMIGALIVDVIVFASAATVFNARWLLVVGMFTWLIASVIYTPCLESTRGQTYGKQRMRLLVVSENGSPATTGQCVKRYLGWFVDGITIIVPLGAIVALTSERHQRLGDMFAHTLVVNE